MSKMDKSLSPPVFVLSRKYLFFMSAAYIQVHFRLDFIMKANTMFSTQEMKYIWYLLKKCKFSLYFILF